MTGGLGALTPPLTRPHKRTSSEEHFEEVNLGPEAKVGGGAAFYHDQRNCDRPRDVGLGGP